MRSKNCGSDFVIKNGFNKNEKHKCKNCHKIFVLKNNISSQKLLTSYIAQKKTLKSLAKDAKKSTIQRTLKSIEIAAPQKLDLKEIMLLIDTTYWGKNFGVVVFKDAISDKFIWWHFISGKEKLEHYKLGFKWCEEQGYIIKAVVSDGFKGLAKTLYPVPFGICQFHILKAVIKKLTRKPPNGLRSKKSIAGIELLALSKELFNLSCSDFKAELENWREKHKDFLGEKSIDKNGKCWYTHARLRSAYNTFKRNLEFLFTYESVENLPKTNNALESEFAHLKTKLRVHNGLKLTNKMKFISHYFRLKNEER